MFHNNPLLTQLKQQLHYQTPRIEGIVKSTDKGFGFLEVTVKKSVLIPSFFMKKVMHGDKIIAVLRHANDRKIAEPETLIEPFLSRFVGRIYLYQNIITIIPDHPSLLTKYVIPADLPRSSNIYYKLNTGDWVLAEMRHHPLNGYHNFYAEIITLITPNDDNFAPWLVTLARYNLELDAPSMPDGLTTPIDRSERKDLTALDFITIDSKMTEDIDDALHVACLSHDRFVISIAIADPTAWVPVGSTLDMIASDRAFTHYFPGFNIPMLPRMLSETICSLRAYEPRPALVCEVTVYQDGTLGKDAGFFTAWVKSKAKLNYNDVSNWLETKGTGIWQPENQAIADQIDLLYRVYQARRAWRKQHALMLKERPEYRFVLSDQWEVKNILQEPRRIANNMIEEAMITANHCAARLLRDYLGYGLYNIHNGFDPTLINNLVNILHQNNINVNATDLLTLKGFCSFRRQLDTMPTSSYLENRIRRFHSCAEISTKPGPHFGLGLEVYATWTSPMRKYGDIVNHRLLKALLGTGKAVRPSAEIILRLSDRRRQNRMAERDVVNWLYARFLQTQVGEQISYQAEIIDIYRSGIRVKLVDNGAIAFIPATFIHKIREELVCSHKTGIVQIRGKELFRQGDLIAVTLAEVNMETRSIIARPI